MPQNGQQLTSEAKPMVKGEPIRDEFDKSSLTTTPKKRKGEVAQNVQSPSKKGKTISEGDRKTGAWSKAEDKLL